MKLMDSNSKKRSIRKSFAKRVGYYRNWATDNWFKYSLYKNIIFLVSFPLAFFWILPNSAFNRSPFTFFALTEKVQLTSFGLGLFFMVFPVFMLFFFYFVDPARMRVMRKKPLEYLRAERLNDFFIKFLFPIFIVVPFASLAIFFALVQFQTIALVILIIFAFSFATMYGLLLNVYLSLMESPELGALIRVIYLKTTDTPKKNPLPNFRSVLQSEPTPLLSAYTRLVAVDALISSKPTRKELRVNLPYFKAGLKFYDSYLKQEFGYVLANPKKFYNYAKVSCCCNAKIDDIKTAMTSLLELIRKEEEPTKVVECLKQMVNEDTSFKSVCSEIEVDPNFIERRINAHSGLIALVGLILTPIITLISLVLFFMGITPSPF